MYCPRGFTRLTPRAGPRSSFISYLSTPRRATGRTINPPLTDRPAALREMIDLLEIDGLLDESACDSLRGELQAAGGGAASLLGGEVRTHVRKATRVAVSPAASGRVKSLLMQCVPRLERHFGLTLGECEAPQFLRYQTGDYFVAHQDGNTPLIHDDSRFRKVSVVVFLSRQSEEPLPDSY